MAANRHPENAVNAALHQLRQTAVMDELLTDPQILSDPQTVIDVYIANAGDHNTWLTSRLNQRHRTPMLHTYGFQTVWTVRCVDSHDLVIFLQNEPDCAYCDLLDVEVGETVTVRRSVTMVRYDRHGDTGDSPGNTSDTRCDHNRLCLVQARSILGRAYPGRPVTIAWNGQFAIRQARDIATILCVLTSLAPLPEIAAAGEDE